MWHVKHIRRRRLNAGGTGDFSYNLGSAVPIKVDCIKRGVCL